MQRILIIKTAALGDVLRTTSILPGLAARHPGAQVTWATAPGAVDLVAHHPAVARVVAVDPGDARAVEELTARLAGETWDWVLSFDDEESLCRLASGVPSRRLSGAHLEGDGRRAYTSDVGPWFDMGLLSVHGKRAADRLKVLNRRSHAAIFADMLGLEPGEPELPLAPQLLGWARARLGSGGRVIGLNTGAGGRWLTKELPPERTVAFARQLAGEEDEPLRFLVLGGPPEAERNETIRAALEAALGRESVVDGGTDNDLVHFAALISACDLLLSSDSLALHVAIARRVPVVAFFAPTSAAEIELFGRGEKVLSTAPDYCSYRSDADNRTITPARLVAAARRVLAAAPEPHA